MSRRSTLLVGSALVGLLILGTFGKSEGQNPKGSDSMIGTFTAPTLSSTALAGASALRCTAAAGVDKPSGNLGKSAFPSLYERSLELTACTVLHGAAKPPAHATLTGYTQLSTAQRADDPREATLLFDTQRLFDRPWSASFPVLLILGGPAVSAPLGANQKVPVLSGSAEPVRAFALIGADASLATAIPHLVGWQVTRTIATAQAALAAGHPLLALDALRVAVHDAAIDQIVLAGTDLFHPSQPSAVRVAAIELVAAAIAGAKAGSPDADRLAEVALLGWEAEQRARVDTAYVRSLTHAAPQLRGSKLHDRARAVANAPNATELATLLKELAAGLK